jgi:hypothetical protein
MFTTRRANCCKLIDVPEPLARLRRRLPSVPGVAIALTLCLSPETKARADTPSSEGAAEARRSEARTKFEAGVNAYREHRYADAVQAFQQADALEPSAALSFNIARAFTRLDNVPAALRWYRDFLRRSPQAPNAAEVQASVNQLSATLAERGVQQISVLSTPSDAKVLIDGQAVGVTPFTAEIAPGAHHVSLSLAGYREQTADFVLAARTPQDVALRLEPLGPSAAKPVGSAAPAEALRLKPALATDHEHRFGAVPWVVLGAGAASMMGALGFELARRSAESAAKSASQLEYKQHFDAMESRQTTARVFLGVGGALLITGGVLVILNTPRKPASQLALSCDGAGCGVTALGSFE